jgi:hypothetical protein
VVGLIEFEDSSGKEQNSLNGKIKMRENEKQKKI